MGVVPAAARIVLDWCSAMSRSVQVFSAAVSRVSAENRPGRMKISGHRPNAGDLARRPDRLHGAVGGLDLPLPRRRVDDGLQLRGHAALRRARARAVIHHFAARAAQVALRQVRLVAAALAAEVAHVVRHVDVWRGL